MKKVIVTTMILLTALLVQAQDSNKFTEFAKKRLVFDVEAGWATGSKTHLSQSIDLGVMMNRRVYAFASFGNDWLLYKQDGLQGYCHTGLLGGGLGFRWLYNEERRMSLDLRMKVEQSIGSKSMNCTVYDAGLRLRLGGKLLVPTIGIGFRHEHMHTSGLSHQNYPYISIGISL